MNNDPGPVEIISSSSQSKGFGDTVAKFTHATGIDKLFADKKTGQPCGGCQKRREALNQMFPYKDSNG